MANTQFLVFLRASLKKFHDIFLPDDFYGRSLKWDLRCIFNWNILRKIHQFKFFCNWIFKSSFLDEIAENLLSLYFCLLVENIYLICGTLLFSTFTGSPRNQKLIFCFLFETLKYIPVPEKYKYRMCIHLYILCLNASIV